MNRMPDENTNPVGTTQTSQNDQATTSQTGNDFTIDFGGEGNKDETTSEGVELNLGERNNEGEVGDGGSGIDLGFADDTHEGEVQENNINIQDLDSLLNEKQNDEPDISLDDSTNENKQDNLEEQENKEGENDVIISNEEDKVENNQNIENENNKEEFDISLGDTNQDEIEKEQNNELQENNTENDNSIHFEEEKRSEIEETNNEEVSDFNNNPEENTEKDISSESSETNEVKDNQETEENVSEKNIGEIEEKSSQGDDFSISFDENVDSSENSDNNLDENATREEINNDVAQENQNVETENDEKSELLSDENLNMNPENTTDEEISDKEEESQEINTGKVETEDLENNLSSNQEETSENKIEENFTDETNSPEIGTEDKDSNNPTEITNNDEPNDESSSEPSINDDISDNKEETEQIKTNDENSESHDSKPEDFIMNFNLEEDTDSQQTKQPEIGDLMGDSSTNLETPVDENSESSAVDESHDTPEEIPVMNNIDDTNETTSNQEVNQNDMVENNSENRDTEKQDFTLDYVDDENNKQEEIQNNHTEDNIDKDVETQNEPEKLQSLETQEGGVASTYNLDDMPMPNNSSEEHITESNSVDSEKQDLDQNQVDQVNNASESIASESAEKNQNNEIKESGIATLSLDQILDSELNSNPQYADNSKAVPKNVPLNSGFFNKKTVGIMGVVLLLAGFVAVLAFPSKKTERKDGDIAQYTGSQFDEPEHYAGDEPTEDTGEYIEIRAGVEESIDDSISDTESTTDTKRNNPKIDEFPDPSSWEDDIEDSTFGGEIIESSKEKEPVPYTCEGDECAEEDPEEVNDKPIITIEEIESTISKFKSEAEKYYTLGDENQDKKIIKYALQIINLCDNYQGEIEDGEQNIQGTFEEFNSKIIGIKSKIEKYIGGGDEVETFTQSNFKDEYDFEGKDDLLNFINGESL